MALLVLLASVRVAGRDWWVMNAVVFDGDRTVAMAVKAVARRTISFGGVLAGCCKIIARYVLCLTEIEVNSQEFVFVR